MAEGRGLEMNDEMRDTAERGEFSMRDLQIARKIRCHEECRRCTHCRDLEVPEPRCYDPDEGYVLVMGKCGVWAARGEDDAAGLSLCPLQDRAELPSRSVHAGTLSRIAATADRTGLDGELDECF
jgi:hypothetical protein